MLQNDFRLMQLDNFVEMDQQGKGTFDTRKFHKNSPKFSKNQKISKNWPFFMSFRGKFGQFQINMMILH